MNKQKVNQILNSKQKTDVFYCVGKIADFSEQKG